MKKIADEIGCSWPDGASSLDKVYHLAKACLPGTSDDDILRSLQHRAFAMASPAENEVQDFAVVDEAVEVLEKRDEKLVDDAKAAAHHARDEAAAFRVAFRQKAEAVRAAAKATGRSKPPSARQHKYPAGTIDQQEAKRFLPPGAYCWRGRADGVWWAHLEPFKRVARSWAAHGEAEALRLVLAAVWRQHLDVSGLPASACPWAGVLEPDDR